MQLLSHGFFVRLCLKKVGHITNENTFMMCPTFILFDFVGAFIEHPRANTVRPTSVQKSLYIKDYLLASSIATATATVIPTMGLLPAPIKPIISTH